MSLSHWLKVLLRKVFLSVSLFLPLIASAHLLSVSPTTPFPSTVSVSASASALYTVTNTSTIPLTGIEDQSASTLPPGVTISSSTCGSSTPLNPGASCAISLSLQAPSTAATLSGSLRERALPSLDSVASTIGPINIIAPFIVTPSAGANGAISPNSPQSVNYGADLLLTATPSTGYSVNEWTDNGVVTQTGGTTYTLTDVTANHTVSVSFSRPLSQLIAVGLYGSMAQSLDGGNSWSDNLISGQPTISNYVASDCTGSGTDAVCIAAGSRNSNTPLLAVSSAGSWTNMDLAGFTTDSSFNAASCSGSGTTAICLAAGQTMSDLDITSPLLRESIDGGQTWDAPTVSVLTTQGYFNASSCTGSGANTVCTVVGSNDATSAPLLLVGTIVDNNLRWAVPNNIADLVGVFKTTSCTGSGATATCIAAGSDSDGAPLVALSSDGGTTWAVQTIPGFAVTNGYFNASSCTGSGTDIVCSLVGRDLDSGIPFVVMLNNTTWSVANTSAPVSYLNTTSCTGSGATALCIAAGQEATDSQSPILIQSIDSGVTWTAATFSTGGLPTDGGAFNGSNCTGDGASAICTAVGNSNTTLFVQSLNGLTSWTNVTVPGQEYAYYSASSGTSGS